MVAVVSIPAAHLRNFENNQPRLTLDEVLAREDIKRTRVDDCQAACARRLFTKREWTSLFGISALQFELCTTRCRVCARRIRNLPAGADNRMVAGSSPSLSGRVGVKRFQTAP